MRAIRLAVLVWVCLPVPAGAQTVLTLEETVARARERAGAVAVARARVPEAEAALVGASSRLREGPLIEANAGPRSTSGERATDVDVLLGQQFARGALRRARVESATASVERQRAAIEHVAQEAAQAAAWAFLDALAATERLQTVEEAEAISRQLVAGTERRYAAGDVAAIDLNLARIDAARARSTVAAARADLATALGTLRTLLRLPAGEPIELRGTLEPAPADPLPQLESRLDRHPDLVALAVGIREAEAETGLARAARQPAFGVRVGYEREETDSIVLGGLTLAIPSFAETRGALAAGLARTTRARLELETTRDASLSALRSAYAVHAERADLASALARDALPAVADNEGLAQRSYDAGEMNLLDLLLIRRDGVETKLTVVERRLDAARSRLLVDYLSGGLR
jgi:cobalt-zinc-cadmium efflux system outer membrane protein